MNRAFFYGDLRRMEYLPPLAGGLESRNYSPVTAVAIAGCDV